MQPFSGTCSAIAITVTLRCTMRAQQRGRRRNERFIYLAIFYREPRSNTSYPILQNLPNKIRTFIAFIIVFKKQFKYFLLEAAALLSSRCES